MSVNNTKEVGDSTQTWLMVRSALGDFVQSLKNDRESVPISSHEGLIPPQSSSNEIKLVKIGSSAFLHVFFTIPDDFKNYRYSNDNLCEAIKGMESLANDKYKHSPKSDTHGKLRIDRFDSQFVGLKVTLCYKENERVFKQLMSGNSKEAKTFNQNLYKDLVAYDIQSLLNLSASRAEKVDNVKNPYVFDFASKVDNKLREIGQSVKDKASLNAVLKVKGTPRV